MSKLNARTAKFSNYQWMHGYSKWDVFKKNKGKCIYCEQEFRDIYDPRFTIEHLIPISKGGPDIFSNVFPCCRKCNSNRGSMQLNDWLRRLIEKRITYKGVYHITNRLDRIIARLTFLYD